MDEDKPKFASMAERRRHEEAERRRMNAALPEHREPMNPAPPPASIEATPARIGPGGGMDAPARGLEVSEGSEVSGEDGGLLTPATHPNHDVVGKLFVAYCVYAGRRVVFYCDSYDPRVGYWMRRQDCPPEHMQDVQGMWRRNVSERVIGRGFFPVR